MPLGQEALLEAEMVLDDPVVDDHEGARAVGVGVGVLLGRASVRRPADRKSTRLNSSHSQISYAVFCLKKKKKQSVEMKYHQYRVNYRVHMSLRCFVGVASYFLCSAPGHHSLSSIL